MPPRLRHHSSLYHSLLQSLKRTFLLFLALSICVFCCEGIFTVCDDHLSVSWIYSGKSKAFFTSLSLLSTNVCLSEESVCLYVCACARMHYLFQDFTSWWRLKAVMPPNPWWLAGYWLPPNMDSCPFALVLLQSLSLKSHTLLPLLSVTYPTTPNLQVHTRSHTHLFSPSYILLPNLSCAAHKTFFWIHNAYTTYNIVPFLRIALTLLGNFNNSTDA